MLAHPPGESAVAMNTRVELGELVRPLGDVGPEPQLASRRPPPLDDADQARRNVRPQEGADVARLLVRVDVEVLQALQRVVRDPLHNHLPVARRVDNEEAAGRQKKRRASLPAGSELSSTDRRGPLVGAGISAELNLIVAEGHVRRAASSEADVLSQYVVGIEGAPPRKAGLWDATAHYLGFSFVFASIDDVVAV